MSSTTSWRSAAASVCSSRWSVARIFAAPHGCRMKSSPERRRWPLVGPLSERECPAQQVSSTSGLVRGDVRDQLLDEVLVPFLRLDDGHVPSVDGGSAREGSCGRHGAFPKGMSGNFTKEDVHASDDFASERVRRAIRRLITRMLVELDSRPPRSLGAPQRSCAAVRATREALAFGQERAKRLRLVEAHGPGPVERELLEDRSRLGAPRRLARPPTRQRAAPQRVVALVRPRGRAARRAAARPCRSSGSPRRRKARSIRRLRRRRSSCGPSPNAIALPAGGSRSRTRKRRCLPSPTVWRSVSSAPGKQQRHARVAEAERRQTS